MTRHTFLLFALMAFGGLSASAQMSLGYYKFKDGAEYTGELNGKRPNGKGKTEMYTKANMLKENVKEKVPIYLATEKNM